MSWVRRLIRSLGACLLTLLLLMILAIVPGSMIDRGPDASIRVSAFPLALVLFDPFVWTCARNSLAVASACAIGSMLIGVAIGSVAGRSRSRVGGMLWALMLAPMVAGPLLMSPAIASMLGSQGGWDWLAGRTTFGTSAESLARWLGLVWTGLAVGTPLVAIATVSGHRRVDLSWRDAALAVGASRSRAWRDVDWPILRPGVARAGAVVFTLSLVEPAGPIVLDLRRTLAVQLVEAALRFDQPSRAASLAMLSLALALAGRSLLGFWGGATYSREESPESDQSPPNPVRRSILASLLLGVWCGLTTGPLVLWLGRAFDSRLALDRESWSSRIARWWGDPDFFTWVTNSAIVASLSVGLSLLILLMMTSRAKGLGRLISLSCRLIEACPPLVVGVGALACPWLLLALADVWKGAPGGWLRGLAGEASPGRSPGLLLIVALASGHLPILFRRDEATRNRVRLTRRDASRLMGVPDRRATHAGGWGTRSPGQLAWGPAFLAFGLAMTNLAPSLLLTPTSERRTLGPGVLRLVGDPEGLSPRSGGPIGLILGLNLLAFAVASRTRPLVD